MRILDTQPLFININQLADKASSAWDWLKNKTLGTEEKPTALRQFPQEIKKTYEQDLWMPESFRQPVQKAREFLTIPEDTAYGRVIKMGGGVDPLGTFGAMKQVGPKTASIVGKTRLAMEAKALAKKGIQKAGEAFPEFQGFKDLTTKVLNKLVGRTTVSKQFISDLTNAPDLKQVERDLIRNVLDSYGGKAPQATQKAITAEKGIIPQELAQRYVGKDRLTGKSFNMAEEIAKKPKYQKTGDTDFDKYSMEFYKRYDKEIKPQLLKAAKGEFDEAGKVKVIDVDMSGSYKRGTPNPESDLDVKVYYEGTIPEEVLAEKMPTLSDNIFGIHDVHFQRVNLTQAVKGAKETDQIPVAEFAEKVKQELLPLKLKLSSHYEDYNYLPDNLKGNIANAKSHIWESPIKTSAGETHFGNISQNYFGHTRIEDMADVFSKPVNQGNYYSVEGTSKKFGSITEAKNYITKNQLNNTRRVIEVQSDLYQKNPKWQQNLRDRNQLDKVELAREIELDKLRQYNDPTAHYRMAREEVKQAAIDGKTKLQFPTGETAMKIEGLGQTAQWIIPSEVREGGFLTAVRALKIEDLKVGKVISSIGEPQDRSMKWIITDILGDGKFKAVPKESWDIAKKNYGTQGIEAIKRNVATQIEQFDISGKVDTLNPIFHFYEKDLGSYLRNKFGAKQITDNKGVTWWELDIKPEQGKAPVEAFGMLPLFIPQKDEDKQRIQFLQK